TLLDVLLPLGRLGRPLAQGWPDGEPLAELSSESEACGPGERDRPAPSGRVPLRARDRLDGVLAAEVRDDGDARWERRVDVSGGLKHRCPPARDCGSGP